MTRQSISLTEPNDEWMKAQIARKEYSSKSELVNDLLRKARAEQEHLDYIRNRLIEAETAPRSKKSKNEILDGITRRLRDEGKI